MRVTLMPGKDVAMRHFVTLAIQEPAVAWRDTARVCGAESCSMLMYAYGMVLVSRWLLPDKSSSNGVHARGTSSFGAGLAFVQ